MSRLRQRTRPVLAIALASLLLPTAAVANESGYTREQVAANNRAASCWTIIDGGVYNLTDWVRQHPGGSGAIVALCGTDGSTSFAAQHRNASRPGAELKKYFLGPLVTAAAPAATPSASPSPTPTAPTNQQPTVTATPTPSPKAVTKKRTITCVKSKQIRKVTATNPKCPRGFKRR